MNITKPYVDMNVILRTNLDDLPLSKETIEYLKNRGNIRNMADILSVFQNTFDDITDCQEIVKTELYDLMTTGEMKGGFIIDCVKMHMVIPSDTPIQAINFHSGHFSNIVKEKIMMLCETVCELIDVTDEQIKSVCYDNKSYINHIKTVRSEYSALLKHSGQNPMIESSMSKMLYKYVSNILDTVEQQMRFAQISKCKEKVALCKMLLGLKQDSLSLIFKHFEKEANEKGCLNFPSLVAFSVNVLDIMPSLSTIIDIGIILDYKFQVSTESIMINTTIKDPRDIPNLIDKTKIQYSFDTNRKVLCIFNKGLYVDLYRVKPDSTDHKNALYYDMLAYLMIDDKNYKKLNESFKSLEDNFKFVINNSLMSGYISGVSFDLIVSDIFKVESTDDPRYVNVDNFYLLKNDVLYVFNPRNRSISSDYSSRKRPSSIYSKIIYEYIRKNEIDIRDYYRTISELSARNLDKMLREGTLASVHFSQFLSLLKAEINVHNPELISNDTKFEIDGNRIIITLENDDMDISEESEPSNLLVDEIVYDEDVNIISASYAESLNPDGKYKVDEYYVQITPIEVPVFDPLEIKTIGRYRVERLAYRISENDAVFVCADTLVDDGFKLMKKSQLEEIYRKGEGNETTKRRRKRKNA